MQLASPFDQLGYVSHTLTMQAEKYIHALVLLIHSGYNTITPGLNNHQQWLVWLIQSHRLYIYTRKGLIVIRPFLLCVQVHQSNRRLKCFRETDLSFFAQRRNVQLLCCRIKVSKSIDPTGWYIFINKTHLIQHFLPSS